ncbi:MAG: aldo/keto reductase [Micrococcus sp.]|nr:aldo/keto reductase [Micrococcus sp.]
MNQHTEAATVTLHEDITMPALGLGTYKLTGASGQAAIEHALEVGYRHLDTAQAYGNEAEVGAALRASGLPRSDVFVTTKLTADWFAPAERAVAHARAGIETSLTALGLESVDQVLIHWPNPWRTAQEGTYRDLAAALAELSGPSSGSGTTPDGAVSGALTRTWGVSNFLPEHLHILEADGLRAAVNQIQVDPLVQQRPVCRATVEHGAAVVAYMPLGRGGAAFEVPAVLEAARAHGVTPAQVLLRWHVQSGRVAVPRSSDPGRQAENLALDGFALTAEQLAALDAADTGAPARQDAREFGI